MMTRAALCSLLVSACSQPLVADQTAADTAALVEVLASVGIEARCDGALAGGRVSVDAAQWTAATQVLRALGLPRAEPDRPRLVVGPTEAARRDRQRHARRIEALLREQPGVLAAAVVLAGGSAAVHVRHRAEVAEARIRALVRAGGGLGVDAPIAVTLERWTPPSVPDPRGPRDAVGGGLAALGSAGLAAVAWRRRRRR